MKPADKHRPLTAYERRCIRALQTAMLTDPPKELTAREAKLIALRCEQTLRRGTI